MRSTLLILVLMAASARTAVGSTVWIEAESTRERVAGPITPPLLIKDDVAASNGSYVEVAAGNNSQAAAPTVEGVARYAFNVPAAGAFRIWGRVMAPTTADDSFWVRVDGGTPVRWNGIAPGAAWHWTQVRQEGAANPASFALAAGDHTLEVGYREDGTRLDVLVVTDDTGYNPTAPLVGPPASPVVDGIMEWPTATGVSLTWQTVQGALSYVVRKDDGTVLGSLSGHRFRVLTTGINNCYSVEAVAPTGTSVPAGVCAGYSGIARRVFPDFDMSLTPPLQLVNGNVAAAPGTPNQTTAPAAHGRATFDFSTATATRVKVWGSGSAPDTGHDSFWVRMDGGAWIKWNNIQPPFDCNVVHDSDAGGAPKIFDLAAGSHRLEIANRETGTSFWKLFVTDDLGSTPNCHD
jgi:hypothetical protein